MHLPEPLPRNMCIYLCSTYVGMTQHHLHRAQVCPTFEEMGSKRVSQGVRSERSFHSCLTPIFLQQFPEALPGHCSPSIADKKNLTHPALQQTWPCPQGIAFHRLSRCLPIGTMRSLDPLPRATRKPTSRLTRPTASVINSVTRNPVP